MLRSVLPHLGLVCVCACGGNQARVDSPTHEESATASEVSASTAPSESWSHSASADPARKSGGAVARRSGEPPAPGDVVDIGDFCSEHRIVANLQNVERCASTPLGKNPNAQLWCSRREELDDNRVTHYLALYRAQGGHLAKITEFAYAAGPKPLAEHENDTTYYVKLFPDVAGDAQSFEVREEAGLGCDDARKRVHDEFAVYPDVEKPVTELVERVCAARGKYSANGQKVK